jgi:hypothetical protein
MESRRQELDQELDQELGKGAQHSEQHRRPQADMPTAPINARFPGKAETSRSPGAR